MNFPEAKIRPLLIDWLREGRIQDPHDPRFHVPKADKQGIQEAMRKVSNIYVADSVLLLQTPDIPLRDPSMRLLVEPEYFVEAVSLLHDTQTNESTWAVAGMHVVRESLEDYYDAAMRTRSTVVRDNYEQAVRDLGAEKAHALVDKLQALEAEVGPDPTAIRKRLTTLECTAYDAVLQIKGDEADPDRIDRSFSQWFDKGGKWHLIASAYMGWPETGIGTVSAYQEQWVVNAEGAPLIKPVRLRKVAVHAPDSDAYEAHIMALQYCVYATTLLTQGRAKAIPTGKYRRYVTPRKVIQWQS